MYVAVTTISSQTAFSGFRAEILFQIFTSPANRRNGKNKQNTSLKIFICPAMTNHDEQIIESWKLIYFSLIVMKVHILFYSFSCLFPVTNQCSVTAIVILKPVHRTPKFQPNICKLLDYCQGVQ